MSLPLEFHPSVRVEVADAHRWYERQRAGLGADFLAELERVLAAVAAHPARYEFVAGDTREGPLARLPYAADYRELPDRVRVLAVYHAARDPIGWQSRAYRALQRTVGAAGFALL